MRGRCGERLRSCSQRRGADLIHPDGRVRHSEAPPRNRPRCTGWRRWWPRARRRPRCSTLSPSRCGTCWMPTPHACGVTSQIARCPSWSLATPDGGAPVGTRLKGEGENLAALVRSTEARVEQFTELVATAIANAESRAELSAFRARVVAPPTRLADGRAGSARWRAAAARLGRPHAQSVAGRSRRSGKRCMGSSTSCRNSRGYSMTCASCPGHPSSDLVRGIRRW